jgi:hypothetical protein
MGEIANVCSDDPRLVPIPERRSVAEVLPKRQGFQIPYISRKIELIFDTGKAIAWELS